MSWHVLRRSAAGALLATLLYVVAGELLQGWTSLHLDAWQSRPAFGSERDRVEWQRVLRGADTAQEFWPWKTSLYRDAARIQLFGVRGGFVSESDGGSALLVAIRQATARSSVDGELLILEIRGDVLVRDYPAASAALQRLKKVAPHARHYWQPLVRMLAARSVQDPALQAIADDARAHYANSRN